MLKKFIIEAQNELPGIILDPQKNEFLIYGRILPEDGVKFFAPVLAWLAKYIKAPNEKTEFYFRLDYYNSSTARMLTKIIVELEQLQEKGKAVKVIWEYFVEDEIMKERGEELKSISFLPFVLKPIYEKISW